METGAEKWPARVLLMSEREAVTGMGGTSRRTGLVEKRIRRLSPCGEGGPVGVSRRKEQVKRQGCGAEGGSSVRCSPCSSRSVLCFLPALC